MNDFAGRLFGAGKRAAEHRAVSAEEERFGEGAMTLDAAVSDERHARVPDGQPALDERLELRDAKARRHASRAAAAWSDPDLDAVGSSLEQEARTLGGRHVASDHLDVAEPLAEFAHGLFHDDGVAMRDVDDEDVDAGADELGRALQIVPRGANGGTDPQPALLVTRGKRQSPLVHEVARRDEPEQPAASPTSGSFFTFRSTMMRSASDGSSGP